MGIIDPGINYPASNVIKYPHDAFSENIKKRHTSANKFVTEAIEFYN